MADQIEDGPWMADGEDTIEIDGKEWPGFATVTVTRGNKWDTKVAKGQHSSDRNYTGAEDAKVTIAIRVWTRAQRDYIDETLISSVEPEPGKTAVGAISVKHSVFTSRKVPAITVDDVQGWERTSYDEAVLTIRAQECRPPVSTNATGHATGSTSLPPGNRHNTDCDTLYAQYVTARTSSMVYLSTGDEVNYRTQQVLALAIQGQMEGLGCGNSPPAFGVDGLT